MNSLKAFVPEASYDKVASLIQDHKLIICVVNQRKTKHGDFRRLPNGLFQITINNNLNRHQFLLTLIHEIAHHITFQKHGHVKAHGKEWKQTFQRIMLPFLHPTIYPEDILPFLANYLKNPKASTDSDVKLSLALKYHQAESGKSFIFELPKGAMFEYKNKRYQKGNKRRTRFECLDLNTKRVYLFNQNAEVSIYEE